MEKKHLYIISGPNGAGKTTASMEILPQLLCCEEFINADEIARGLSPFNPEEVAIEAGRIQLQRINCLLNRGVDFSIETTLATKSYKNLVHKAQLLGYEVELLFFWLPSPEVAIERVHKRVLSGGHNIPEDVIRRRYDAGIKNLFKIYMPIVDKWKLMNNYKMRSEYIAIQNDSQEVIINDVELFHNIKNYAEQ